MAQNVIQKSASSGTTIWTGGQTRDMTASQVGETLLNGLKTEPLIETITQVVVSAKKVSADAYNWAFGDSNESALAKQDLWTNKIHYANGLMGLGLLRGVRPTSFFRGARPGTKPSFTPRPGDYKVDPVTGYVKDTHGVSIFDNAGSVSSKGFEPHQIDLNSMPDTLRIIQRGADPRHFEITPKPGANLTPDEVNTGI